MKYLTLKHLFYVVIFSLLITSCDAPDPVPPGVAVEESTKSLEPTKSIDIPTAVSYTHLTLPTTPYV